jgi:hypothetical protein
MTLLNYLNSDILFYGLYASTACFLGLSFYNAWYYPFDNTQVTVETPTTDSGLETITALSSSTIQPSPTLHYFTPDQLRSIVDLTDEGSIIERTFVDKAIQTGNSFEGINLNLDLSPITLNLTPKVSPLQAFINNHLHCFCYFLFRFLLCRKRCTNWSMRRLLTRTKSIGFGCNFN